MWNCSSAKWPATRCTHCIIKNHAWFSKQSSKWLDWRKGAKFKGLQNQSQVNGYIMISVRCENSSRAFRNKIRITDKVILGDGIIKVCFIYTWFFSATELPVMCCKLSGHLVCGMSIAGTFNIFDDAYLGRTVIILLICSKFQVLCRYWIRHNMIILWFPIPLIQDIFLTCEISYKICLIWIQAHK
jgi:hypothetical protein